MPKLSTYGFVTEIASTDYFPLVTGGTGENKNVTTLTLWTSVFQAKNDLLTAIGELASSADKYIYFTAFNNPALGDITSYGRTLLGLADATALKDNLELGTAAFVNTGTAVGDVVVLVDVGGGVPGLPAVDGSLLTGISGGGGGTTNHTALSNLAWASSGHTGLASTVAAFDGSGDATTLDASAVATLLGLGNLATLDTVGTAEIDNSAVTLAKIENCSGGRVLGQATGDSGPPTEIIVSTGLSIMSAMLKADVVTVAGRSGNVVLTTADIGGLGTAAALDVGTTASKVVQLDGSAKLPAVDGSQLTNVAASAHSVLRFKDTMHIRYDLTGFSAGISGSGSQHITSGFRSYTASGTTAGSTALRYFHAQSQQGLSAGKNYSVLNWSKAISMSFMVTQTVSTANGTSRLYLGAVNTATPGAPGTKAIGFRLDGNALKGICHDGTTLTTVDLSTTLTANSTYALCVQSDGAGNITWYVNGTSAGTSAAGPTGDSTTSYNALQQSVGNGADAANQDLWVHQATGVISI